MRMFRFAAPKSAGVLASATLVLLLAPASSSAQVATSAQPSTVYRSPVTSTYRPGSYVAPGYARTYTYPARPALVRRTRPVSRTVRNWPTGRDLPLYKPWLQPR